MGLPTDNDWAAFDNTSEDWKIKALYNYLTIDKLNMTEIGKNVLRIENE